MPKVKKKRSEKEEKFHLFFDFFGDMDEMGAGGETDGRKEASSADIPQALLAENTGYVVYYIMNYYICTRAAGRPGVEE